MQTCVKSALDTARMLVEEAQARLPGVLNAVGVERMPYTGKVVPTDLWLRNEYIALRAALTNAYELLDNVMDMVNNSLESHLPVKEDGTRE